MTNNTLWHTSTDDVLLLSDVIQAFPAAAADRVITKIKEGIIQGSIRGVRVKGSFQSPKVRKTRSGEQVIKNHYEIALIHEDELKVFLDMLFSDLQQAPKRASKGVPLEKVKTLSKEDLQQLAHEFQQKLHSSAQSGRRSKRKDEGTPTG